MGLKIWAVAQFLAAFPLVVLPVKEQALCFLLGVTVNQPVFMRGKEQDKQSLVEGIEVHDSDGEWSGRGYESSPSQSGCMLKW